MITSSVDDLAAILGPWQLDRGPLWRRLGNRLVTLIDEGVLPERVRLPAERTLAARLEVSRSTATAAYRYARTAGRLDSRQGAGSWTVRPPSSAMPVPATGSGAFDTLGRRIDGVIDLSLAETRCDRYTRSALAGLDPGWLQAATGGTGYHPQGLPALREALAGYLSAVGVRSRADDVLITTGAQQAIWLASTVMCPPGSTVLVETASYPGALEVFRRLGLRTLPIPTDADGPDPRALAALAARSRPTMAYLVPVGNNPTGVITPGHRLDALAEVFTRHGILVLEDRTAVPLADPAAVPVSLAARLPPGACVVVGSMSKVAWAGVRTGWIVAPSAMRRDLLAARIAIDLAGSLVSQTIALHLVPHLDALSASVRTDLRTHQQALRTALARELPEWEGDEPAVGAWRWMRLPGDARLTARAAAEQGVLVTPGPQFSPLGGLTDRVRIAAVEPPEILAEGVRRLGLAWRTVEHSAAADVDDRDLLLI